MTSELRKTDSSEDRELARYFEQRHRCHAVILYGSRATGRATAASDYDVLALRSSGRAVRDVSGWRAGVLDAFIEPDTVRPSQELFRILGGRVLLDRRGTAKRLMSAVKRLHARGRPRLSVDQRAALEAWLQRMLARVRGAEPVASFRRAQLLFEGLELWFAFRARWFPGPVAALSELSVEAPAFHRAYTRALIHGDANALTEMVRLISAAAPRASSPRALRPRKTGARPTQPRSRSGLRAR